MLSGCCVGCMCGFVLLHIHARRVACVLAVAVCVHVSLAIMLSSSAPGGQCCCACAGTPLQNNMVELYGLLSFMYPDVFTTPGPFEAAFNLVKGQVRRKCSAAQLCKIVLLVSCRVCGSVQVFVWLCVHGRACMRVRVCLRVGRGGLCGYACTCARVPVHTCVRMRGSLYARMPYVLGYAFVRTCMREYLLATVRVHSKLPAYVFNIFILDCVVACARGMCVRVGRCALIARVPAFCCACSSLVPSDVVRCVRAYARVCLCARAWLDVSVQ
jgi:hypothetical protein